ASQVSARVANAPMSAAETAATVTLARTSPRRRMSAMSSTRRSTIARREIATLSSCVANGGANRDETMTRRADFAPSGDLPCPTHPVRLRRRPARPRRADQLLAAADALAGDEYHRQPQPFAVAPHRVLSGGVFLDVGHGVGDGVGVEHVREPREIAPLLVHEV